MSELEKDYQDLMAYMEKADQDRLWDHFVQTGQVLPSAKETLAQIKNLEQQIKEIEKLQWINFN